MISLKKKGAEESNVIIFVILALVVAGLVIYFAWNFFNVGTSLIDGNDPSVTAAVESCKIEIGIQPDAYCNSAKFVKIQGGGEMIVNCEYLNNSVRKGFIEAASLSVTACTGTPAFNLSQCNLIKSTTDNQVTVNNTIVNGAKCSDILKLTSTASAVAPFVEDDESISETDPTGSE